MRQRTSLTALLVATAFVACAIDDRKLDVVHDEGGGGSRGGSAGSTGGSDEGGTAGNGGTAGKGGAAGSAGRGGTVSTGGTAGTAGTGPTDCNGDPLDIDEDLIRACLMQTGCSPFVPSSSLSFCITNQRLNTFPQDDCGSNADDCSSFLDCLGVGYYSPSGCTTGDAAYCESTTLAVTCNRYPYAIDCAQSGGECATFTDTTGTLRARCRHPALEGCTDPPETAQCGATDIAYTCVNGQAFGTDCGEVGSECRDGTCYYVLPTCTTPGLTCDGETSLDICYDNNDLAGYDCASGLGCVEDDATTAECRAPGCATDEACSESCSGTELTFCYGRVPVTVDCADYGFRTCLTTTLNDTVELTSFCAFPETAPDRACEVRDIDDACFACGKEYCCTEWTACLDDPDCLDYLVCANECAGASACIDVCESMYLRGLAVYTEYAICRDTACAVDCG